MVVECQVCKARNRVDEIRARTLRPTCGRCGAHLPYEPERIITATDATWQSLVAQSADRPLLVDFWAPWCGPCRMLAPIIDELARQANGRYTVAKLNTDENPRTAQELGIDSIPTLLVFRSGQLVERAAGVQPREAILRLLASHMAA